MGGWRFGNTIDGAQAEYLLVPDAWVNLAHVPSGLTDEQVLMCPDIMSTGFPAPKAAGQDRRLRRRFAGPDRAVCDGRRPADGRDAHHRRGGVPEQQAMAPADGRRQIVFSKGDPVDEIMRLTEGRGVDVAIEALGRQETFSAALRVLRPGGTLSSLGVYSSDLTIPLGASRRVSATTASSRSARAARNGCGA
jgi:threonine dehydrogenase-like Zn-dependent dehydrogenase